MHYKVHLICLQLCATMKVICVQLTGRRAADQLSPLSLFPTFPPPPSHKNAWSALTLQLLLLNFCDPPSLEASDRSLAPHGWLLRQCCAIAAVFALAGWLAFLGTLQSNRQQLLYVLLCYFFSFLVWAFPSPFFCVFLIFLYTFLHASF